MRRSREQEGTGPGRRGDAPRGQKGVILGRGRRKGPEGGTVEQRSRMAWRGEPECGWSEQGREAWTGGQPGGRQQAQALGRFGFRLDGTETGGQMDAQYNFPALGVNHRMGRDKRGVSTWWGTSPDWTNPCSQEFQEHPLLQPTNAPALHIWAGPESRAAELPLGREGNCKSSQKSALGRFQGKTSRHRQPGQYPLSRGGVPRVGVGLSRQAEREEMRQSPRPPGSKGRVWRLPFGFNKTLAIVVDHPPRA